METNKVISASIRGINIFYTDTFKSSNIYYSESILKDIQQNASSSLPRITNGKQKELYNQAMFGLRNYTAEEIMSMKFSDRLRITDIFDRSQYLLNIWKQELVHQKVGSFLTTKFKKSEFAYKLATYPKAINPREICTFTFKDLRIRKEHIVQKLIEFGILPVNFFEIV